MTTTCIYKDPIYYSIDILENLIQSELKNNPPILKNKTTTLSEEIMCIIDAILTSTYFNEESKIEDCIYSGAYNQVHRIDFETVSRRNYGTIIKWLKERDIIECDNQYFPKKKYYSYRILGFDGANVTIKPMTGISGRIRSYIERKRTNKIRKAKNSTNYNFNEKGITFNNDFLKSPLYKSKKLKYDSEIKEIASNEIYSSTKSFRTFTSWNALPSIFKLNLQDSDGDAFTEYDVKSMSCVSLYHILLPLGSSKEYKKELRSFKAIIKKDFYNWILSNTRLKISTRKSAKEYFNKFLNGKVNKVANIFKKSFPLLTNQIDIFKSLNGFDVLTKIEYGKGSKETHLRMSDTIFYMEELLIRRTFIPVLNKFNQQAGILDNFDAVFITKIKTNDIKRLFKEAVTRLGFDGSLFTLKVQRSPFFSIYAPQTGNTDAHKTVSNTTDTVYKPPKIQANATFKEFYKEVYKSENSIFGEEKIEVPKPRSLSSMDKQLARSRFIKKNGISIERLEYEVESGNYEEEIWLEQIERVNRSKPALVRPSNDTKETKSLPVGTPISIKPTPFEVDPFADDCVWEVEESLQSCYLI